MVLVSGKSFQLLGLQIENKEAIRNHVFLVFNHVSRVFSLLFFFFAEGSFFSGNQEESVFVQPFKIPDPKRQLSNGFRFSSREFKEPELGAGNIFGLGYFPGAEESYFFSRW